MKARNAHAPNLLSKLLIAVILVGSLSCASARHSHWTFGVSRTVYGSGSVHCDDFDRADLFIALLPLAIDLIVLPISLAHDYYTHEQYGHCAD